jgi:hypothetical protein
MDTESASLDHGNSGGPFYAFWANEDFPRVVSIASAEGSLNFDDDNWAAGGPPLDRMIARALIFRELQEIAGSSRTDY